MVSCFQKAFVEGRQILAASLIANEKSRRCGMLCKLDVFGLGGFYSLVVFGHSPGYIPFVYSQYTFGQIYYFL